MSAYDNYLADHIQKFGNKPELQLIGYSHDHLELWDTNSCTVEIAKVLSDEFAWAIYNEETDTYYEIQSTPFGNSLYQVVDSRAYEKWHTPMPYWIYSKG